MAKTRTQKEEEVKAFLESAKNSKAAIIVRYSGVPVKQEQELRSNLRKDGNRYVAMKKTLLARSLKELNLSTEDLGDLSGSLAVAFGPEDEVSVAKTLHAFAKEAEGFEFVGGIYNEAIITKDEVERLAVLPPTEELLAKFVSVVSSPLRGMVQVLQGTNRGLVQALHAIQEQKS